MGQFLEERQLRKLGEELLKPYGLAGSCHWPLIRVAELGELQLVGSSADYSVLSAAYTSYPRRRRIHKEKLLVLLAVGGAIVGRWQ